MCTHVYYCIEYQNPHSTSKVRNFGEGRKFWLVLRTLKDYLRVKTVLRLELELGLCWAQRVMMIRVRVRPINVLTKIGQCVCVVCVRRQSAAISVVTC